MATDRTPPHKRIARAEQSAVEWKMKATERREENERLKSTINDLQAKVELLTEQNKKCDDLGKQVESLMGELKKTHEKMVEQQNMIDDLKKKLVSRRSKAIQT
jgi:septal ring factor EnvC (AmiA/AmiB activator)